MNVCYVSINLVMLYSNPNPKNKYNLPIHTYIKIYRYYIDIHRNIFRLTIYSIYHRIADSEQMKEQRIKLLLVYSCHFIYCHIKCKRSLIIFKWWKFGLNILDKKQVTT